MLFLQRARAELAVLLPVCFRARVVSVPCVLFIDTVYARVSQHDCHGGNDDDRNVFMVMCFYVLDVIPAGALSVHRTVGSTWHRTK